MDEIRSKLVGLIEEIDSTSSTSEDKIEDHMSKLFPSGRHNKRKDTGKTKKLIKPTPEDLWGPLQKKKKSKSKSSSLDVRKEVFLLPDPNIDSIPRRSGRQFYYKNGLVGCSVKFSSDMCDEDIKEVIRQSIPCLKERKCFPAFSFVKVVEDTFVDPKINDWDYKTIRHVFGQGPVYVRSEKKLDINFLEKCEDEMFDNDCFDDDFDVMVETSPFNKVYSQTSEKTPESNSCGESSSSKTIISYFGKGINCPICGESKCKDTIQSHVNECLEKQDREQRRLQGFQIQIQEDDDEVLEETLPFGCEPRETETVKEPKKTVKELILLCAKNIEGNFRLNVRRESCWEEFAEKISPKKRWCNGIGYYKIHFLGETAIDTGGPRREFFSVALQQMRKSLLPDGVPIKSVMAVAKNLFFKAGRLMIASLLQGGPSPSILKDWCFEIVSRISSISPTEFSIPGIDSDELCDLKKINDAKSDEQLRNALMLDSSMELLQLIGYQGVPNFEKIENKELIVRSIYFKLVIEPSVPALEQMREGMDALGFLEVLEQNSDVFRDSFVYKAGKLDVDEFVKLLNPKYSVVGSNNREKEMSLYKHFCDMIDECYNDPQELHLHEVLQFVTGADKIPDIDFEKTIDVEFIHCISVDCRCLPTASTCSLTLTLPVHNFINSSEQMAEVMSRAVKEGKGFGCV